MKQSSRFDLRFTDEDRARLRELATRTCRSEADVVRLLLRQADTRPYGGIVLQRPVPINTSEPQAAA